jgi:hypothetical protein
MNLRLEKNGHTIHYITLDDDDTLTVTDADGEALCGVNAQGVVCVWEKAGEVVFSSVTVKEPDRFTHKYSNLPPVIQELEARSAQDRQDHPDEPGWGGQ